MNAIIWEKIFLSIQLESITKLCSVKLESIKDYTQKYVTNRD